MGKRGRMSQRSAVEGALWRRDAPLSLIETGHLRLVTLPPTDSSVNALSLLDAPSRLWRVTPSCHCSLQLQLNATHEQTESGLRGSGGD